MTARLPRLPVALSSPSFARDKFAHYDWMLREAPVCQGRLSVFKATLVAPYAECRALLQDRRFLRNRSAALGRTSRLPLPRGLRLVTAGLTTHDNDVHKRQRSLVAKAFSPRVLQGMEARIGEIVDERLDTLYKERRIDLLQAFCLPIPTTVIRELLGVEPQDMPRFHQLLDSVTAGLAGLTLIHMFLFRFPKTFSFVEEMLERKRSRPEDDLLTGLLEAEDEGTRLTHDELVMMTLTLVLAGYETTVHLLGNAFVALLSHRDQLARLREDPTLMELAVEEVMRLVGPAQGSKPHFPSEDVEILGVPIKRGTPVVALIGAANRDPEAFSRPGVFDISRTPNKHLGFGHGPHYCLGAALARMEGRIALARFFARFPNVRLDVRSSDLRLQPIPLWHRYRSIPVRL